MMSIVLIFMIVLVLVLSSFGYGRLVFKNEDWHKQVLFGGLAVFALSELFDLILVPFRVPTAVCFGIYALILLAGWAGLFFGGKSKWSFKAVLLLLGYLAVMAWIHSNRALGEPSFDSSFYLSHVIEGSTASVFGSVYYETGLWTGTLSSMYDFQSFYHLNSFFLMIAQWVITMLNLGAPVVTHLYIWSMTLYFYVLLFCFCETALAALEVKNSLISICIRIFVLGIAGNFYWNNALAFYGNTYRQLASAVLALWVYEMMKKKEYSFHSFMVLCMISASMFSFSSSALFICFISFFSLICISFQFEMTYRGSKYFVILLPMALFGLCYCWFTYHSILPAAIAVSLFFGFCLAYDYLLNPRVQALILAFLKRACSIILPLILTAVSLYLWTKQEFEFTLFFENYSSMDMVWDYFRLDELVLAVLNLLYLTGMVLLLKNRKEISFSSYLIYAVMTFINPVNIILVRKFLAYIVFYRSYEVVMNLFACILLIVLVLRMFEKNRLICTGFACLFCVLSVVEGTSYYHHFYRPSEHFNKLYKVENLELEMLQVFSEVVSYEDERVTVVSQMDSLKGFVPNMTLAFSMRDVSLYSVNSGKSDLLKIFYPRMHAGQQMFDTEPDFKCACDELIEQRIDYVIIDKNQVYWDNGKYEHLYFLVRDCAELVHENDRYALFRFYW